MVRPDGQAGAWANTTVNGMAMGDAFKQWYFRGGGGGGGASSSRWIEGCAGTDGSCGADKCGA